MQFQMLPRGRCLPIAQAVAEPAIVVESWLTTSLLGTPGHPRPPQQCAPRTTSQCQGGTCPSPQCPTSRTGAGARQTRRNCLLNEWQEVNSGFLWRQIWAGSRGWHQLICRALRGSVLLIGQQTCDVSTASQCGTYRSSARALGHWRWSLGHSV